MNLKLVLMSIIVLGLIVNLTSFSDLAFADKPDKEKSKTLRADAKEQREIQRADAKEQREIQRADAKAAVEAKKLEAQTKKTEDKSKGNGVQEFGENGVVTSSSSTICHIPRGNPLNNHTIHVGPAAVNAHVNNHGDAEMACENVDWGDFWYKFEDGDNNGVQEFGENGVVTSSSSTICHIPRGNPLNNHTIHVGPAAVNAHVNNHGDAEMACENVDWGDFWYKFEDQEFEPDENLIAQISQQIEELQQRLQQLLGF